MSYIAQQASRSAWKSSTGVLTSQTCHGQRRAHERMTKCCISSHRQSRFVLNDLGVKFAAEVGTSIPKVVDVSQNMTSTVNWRSAYEGDEAWRYGFPALNTSAGPVQLTSQSGGWSPAGRRR